MFTVNKYFCYQQIHNVLLPVTQYGDVHGVHAYALTAENVEGQMGQVDVQQRNGADPVRLFHP